MSSANAKTKQNPQQAPGAQAAADAMKPGPEHAQLAKRVGTWDVSCAMWMKDGEEPTRSQGTAVLSSLFDGRFLREVFTGQMGGQPFQGVGTMGFDRVAKEYVNVWYDSVGTGIIVTRGPATGDGRELTLSGTFSCPTQGAGVPVRHVYAQESDERFTLTMFQTKDGKDSKSMELAYKRKRD